MLLLLANACTSATTQLPLKFLPQRPRNLLTRCLLQNQAALDSHVPALQAWAGSEQNLTDAQLREAVKAISNKLLNSTEGHCLNTSLLTDVAESMTARNLTLFLLFCERQLRDICRQPHGSSAQLFSLLLAQYHRYLLYLGAKSNVDQFLESFQRASGMFRHTWLALCVEKETLGLIADALNSMDISNYVILLDDMWQKLQFLKLKSECKYEPILSELAEFVRSSSGWDFFTDLAFSDPDSDREQQERYVQLFRMSGFERATELGRIMGGKVRAVRDARDKQAESL